MQFRPAKRTRKHRPRHETRPDDVVPVVADANGALMAEIARAPVGKVEVYDTPEQWRYVIVPDHFDSGQRVRLLLVREGGDA